MFNVCVKADFFSLFFIQIYVIICMSELFSEEYNYGKRM